MSVLIQSLVFLCCSAGLISVAMFVSWFCDSKRLNKIARTISQNSNNASESIIRLTEWVYSNQGFAKNRKYFIVRRFGPTPIDVLEYGGDCADKSRLLSALLKQVGIRSTLAMLYPCQNCDPVHTVVEAEYEDGWMVTDPVYNLWFPTSPNEYCGEQYMGLRSLQSDPSVVEDRLKYLREFRGSTDKINYYDDETATYNYARTINWNKNGLFRIAGKAIDRLGIDPHLMRRPRVMEDPKLALSVISGAITIGFAMLYAILQSTRP